MLRENIQTVRQGIAEAARRARRDPSEIKLVAVTKTHPPAVIRDAMDAGLHIFGENKIQEAEAKILEVDRRAAEWHLIGHLQSNKARKAVELFDVIHSVDSIALAERLERICKESRRDDLSVLVQVDLAGEETKSGVLENDLLELTRFLTACTYLKLAGFMLLPPYSEDPEATRPYFARLREIRDRLLPGGELSMGMSHDFEVAIEEGATIIRVGTAIFGERSPN